MKRQFAAAFVAALLPVTASASDVEMTADAANADAARCLAEPRMISYLDRAWGEVPVAKGSLDNGAESILYVSRRGSWTLVQHRTDGKACVEASGVNLVFDRESGATASRAW